MNPAEMRADLIRKGWTIDEIESAIAILKRAPESKTRFVRILDKVVFWVNLVLALTGNFIISVVLIPFMLFASPAYLYPSLFIVGLSFGALYDMVVFDIERIEDAPKIFVGPFLLAIALINIYIITTLNNYLAERIEFSQGMHMPLLVAVVYSAGFMAPYVWTHLDEIRQMIIERKKPSDPQKQPSRPSSYQSVIK